MSKDTMEKRAEIADKRPEVVEKPIELAVPRAKEPADRAPRSERRADNGLAPREILDIDEAAELLGVSVKTFNKVLHNEDIPARKVGREWKFSRRALIEWVGSGRSSSFYREANGRAEKDEGLEEREVERPARGSADRPRSRRTAGWQIEYD